MDFKLERDLVFFDVETTGLDLTKDRIIQLAMIKYPADKSKKIEEVDMLFNPEMPIPAKTTAIHGITDAMVKDQPTFKEKSGWIYLFLKDADLAGFNSNRFDIPILIEEFARTDFNFSLLNRRLIDVQNIYHKMEPRNLRAAYRFYTGQNLENAHNALADVRATAAVLHGQLDKYVGKDVETEDGTFVPSPVVNDMQVLHNFVNNPEQVDLTRRFKREKDGTIVFNFGKHVGQPILENEAYLRWMADSDFPADTKMVCREALAEIKARQKKN